MGRAPCCDKMGVKKGPWTAHEDRILADFIQRNGHDNWRALPKLAGLMRCGKSCRLRWINYLRPDIKRGNFSYEEEEAVIKLHQLLGNRWSAIASRLPGRTDNEIKNVWNTHIKKKLVRMGIDPATHDPLTYHSALPKATDRLDPSECSKEPCPSMEKEKDNLSKVSFDCSEPTPLMEVDSLAKAFWVDSPHLSSEIMSSVSSLESEVISEDSSTLDWLQSNSVNSFEEPQPLEYIEDSSAIEDERFLFDFSYEIGRFEVMCEQSPNGNAHCFMSANSADDFLSREIDEEYKNTHLLQKLGLQKKEDEDLDGASYWLNVLSEAGSSSIVL